KNNWAINRKVSREGNVATHHRPPQQEDKIMEVKKKEQPINPVEINTVQVINGFTELVIMEIV
ncbi:MAG: hypothetical protein JWQ09_647, partial [Segetibacter sp.]|nr:hypothetical protein [Segetibacter sp.]